MDVNILSPWSLRAWLRAARRGTVANGNTIVFSITDAGVGDDDYAPGANGIIVDQGGPGILAPTQIPALSEWSLLLLAGLLMLFALHKKRA